MNKYFNSLKYSLLICLPLILVSACKKETNESAVPNMNWIWNVDSVKQRQYINNNPSWGSTQITSPHRFDFTKPGKIIETYLNRIDTAAFIFIKDTVAVTDLNFDDIPDTVFLKIRNPTQIHWEQKWDNGIMTRHTYYLSKRN